MTFVELFRSNRQYRKLLFLWAARSVPASALGLLLLWTAIQNDSMSRAGVLSAVSALTGLIVPVSLSWLSDRTGRRLPLLVAASAELVALPMVLYAKTTGTTGPILEVATFVSSVGAWTFATMRGTAAVDVATRNNPDSGRAAAIGAGFAGYVPKLMAVPLIWLLISRNGPVAAVALSLFTVAGFWLAYVLPNTQSHRKAAAADPTAVGWSIGKILPAVALLGVVSLVPWQLIMVAVPSSPGWLAVDITATFIGALTGTLLLTVSKPPTMTSTSLYAGLHVAGLLVAVAHPPAAPLAFAAMGLGTSGTWQSLRVLTLAYTPLSRRGFVAAVSSVLAAVAAGGSRLAVGAGFDIIGGLPTVEIVAAVVTSLVVAINLSLLASRHTDRLRFPGRLLRTGR